MDHRAECAPAKQVLPQTVNNIQHLPGTSQTLIILNERRDFFPVKLEELWYWSNASPTVSLRGTPPARSN
jgi:hypothetical protein